MHVQRYYVQSVIIINLSLYPLSFSLTNLFFLLPPLLSPPLSSLFSPLSPLFFSPHYPLSSSPPTIPRSFFPTMLSLPLSSLSFSPHYPPVFLSHYALSPTILSLLLPHYPPVFLSHYPLSPSPPLSPGLSLSLYSTCIYYY